MALSHEVVRNTLAFRTEDERHRWRQVGLRELFPAVRDERNAAAGSLVPPNERDPEDRARRGPERPRPERVGTLVRERDGGAERVRRPKQRADVPRIGHSPERDRDLSHSTREVLPAEHADHARRVPEGRDGGEKLREDVLARDEELGGLDPRAQSRVDEILSLDREEPGLLPVLSRREELADEAELRVVP